MYMHTHQQVLAMVAWVPDRHAASNSAEALLPWSTCYLISSLKRHARMCEWRSKRTQPALSRHILIAHGNKYPYLRDSGLLSVYRRVQKSAPRGSGTLAIRCFFRVFCEATAGYKKLLRWTRGNTEYQNQRGGEQTGCSCCTTATSGCSGGSTTAEGEGQAIGRKA